MRNIKRKMKIIMTSHIYDITYFFQLTHFVMKSLNKYSTRTRNLDVKM